MTVSFSSRLLGITFALLWGAGCVTDASDAPCTAEEECLSGFECVEKICQPCAGNMCGPKVTINIGPSGGTVCGPDNVCIVIPRGAVAAPTAITIRRPEPQPTVSGGRVFVRNNDGQLACLDLSGK